jgi:hypothetical protein
MRLRRSIGMAGLGAVVGILAASPADARTERIRWKYPAPDLVSGFHIHVGAASREYDQVIDAGKPTANANVYEYQLEVADDAVVFVAISAYAAEGESRLSNQVKHKPPRPDDGKKDEWDVLRERFGEYEVGDNPAFWLDTGPGAARGSDDSLFTIGQIGRNETLMTASALDDIHSHYVTPRSATWSRYEYRGRMRIDDPAGGVGVTVLSQYPAQDAYYRVRRDAGVAGGEFAMSPHPNGYAIRCESATTGVVPEAERWYRFRIQVAAEDGETLVRAKVWRSRTPEPRKWQIECIDDAPTRLVEGAPGVWSGGPGAKHWDDLKVVPLASGKVVVGEGKGRRAKPAAPPAKPVLIDPES